MPPVRGELCSSGSPIDWICPNLAVAIRVTSERAESEELRSSRAVWHAIPWSQQSPRVWQETTSDDFARGQDSLSLGGLCSHLPGIAVESALKVRGPSAYAVVPELPPSLPRLSPNVNRQVRELVHIGNPG